MLCGCSQNSNPNENLNLNAGLTAVENLCHQSMNQCQSTCFTDNRNCFGGCNGEPLAMTQPQAGAQISLQRCCDANGCCGLYNSCCRNPFWPSFAHPSWLCCKNLYS